MWKLLGFLGALFVACQPAALPPKSFASPDLKNGPKPGRLEPARVSMVVTTASAATELEGTRAVATQEEKVVSVTAALWASCALLESGTVWCWGDTHATATSDDTTALRQVPLSDVTKLTGAHGRFFALTRSGALYVWGQQRLRVGAAGTSTLPVPVPLGTVLDVAAGRTEFCALERSGRVTCWESDGSSAVVAELPAARSVAVSASMACVRLEDGQVSCFAKDSQPTLRPGVSEVVVCHDELFDVTFRDARGEAQAQVSVGGCGTLTSAPQVPAQHGRGNVVESKLIAGLREICRETGLAVCQDPAR